MGKKPIDRWSPLYKIIKAYAYFCHRLFYRKIQAKFWQRIPKNCPVIMAPSHQNALMDAMAPLHTGGGEIIFLVRSDIFNNKALASVWNLFKMFPIYRMRDGVSELAKNEEIFENTLGVLDRAILPMGIMPEGNHGDKRRLRQLVKGIFRIAFRAQEKYGDQPGVQIVPVGIDYQKYDNFRSKLLVIYGEPVSVAEFYNDYQENSARAINKLRERLSEEMRKYMIDIRTDQYYDTYFSLRSIFNSEMRKLAGIKGSSLYSRFLADKKMIAMLDKVLEKEPERIEKLDKLVTEYSGGIEKQNIRNWIFERAGVSFFGLVLYSLLMILLLPLFIYGLANNIIPSRLVLMISSKIKDIQFHSSVKYAAGLLIFPIVHLLQFGIVAIFVRDWWWVKWAYLVSLIPSGLFAHEYLISLKKMRALWKYFFKKKNTNSSLPSLIRLRTEIIEEMKGISDNYLE